MNNVVDKYNENKLLIRAVDLPSLHRCEGEIRCDCSTWSNEFAMMMNNEFESVSSTLLIPNVGVKTYKNVGFLIDSDLTNIEHIAKSDSGSSGNIRNGDFFANRSDFVSLEQLADYISESKDITMNEINISIPLNAVLGLVVVKCNNELIHIQRMLVVRKCLLDTTGIEFDIFEYDQQAGKITQIDVTEDLVSSLNSLPGAYTKYDFYTDYSDELFEGDISHSGFIR